MGRIKNYLSGFSIILATFVFGQGSFSTTYNPLTEGNTSTLDNRILTPKEKIDVNLSQMMSDPVLRNASWGFVVYDPKTKKVVSAYNENTPLVPASTTKLLTTETALNLLGPKYRWITQLEYSGAIDENGTLNGNLYIVGSGDPSLGTGKAGATSYRNLISDFIWATKDAGIKKIVGDIVIQTAVFKENKLESLPEHIVWMDFGNYFLPVGNTANIDPRKEKLVVKQSNPFSDNKQYFYISPYTNKIVYTDEFTPNYLDTKLADAPAYLANNLRSTMLKSALPISGKVVTKMIDAEPEKRKIISTYKSPTLEEIVYYTNKNSDNALAEALLRMVGFQKSGDQTLDSGRNVVVSHLESAGFDTIGLNYIDGSGLSRSHSVTPISQVKFLSSLMDKKYYPAFYDSLPIGGQDGTLKKMFLGSGYGNVRAKTGTLSKVKTLAGYLKTTTGKTLVFSVLINNYYGSTDQVKARIEQLLEPVLSY